MSAFPPARAPSALKCALRTSTAPLVLVALGVALLAPYAVAVYLQDLRVHTAEFLALYALALALYAAATVVAVRTRAISGRGLLVLFVLAGAMMALLLLTRPTLSDDMYRYIWDGRVQAEGISPYRYPPDAVDLLDLRDPAFWPEINRKGSVTIYPPAAQAAFAVLWRLWSGVLAGAMDPVRWFQVAMAVGALAGGALLVGLLRDLGQSPARAVIYLFSPLLIFETAHSAHLDGLLLPLLVAAWWARMRRRDVLVGVLLGLATAMKLYPAVLLPALWRGPRRRGWALPLAFAATVLVCYMPYLVSSGGLVLGFLPEYFTERFNIGLAGLLIPLFQGLGMDPNQGLLALTLVVLGGLSLAMVLRPPVEDSQALRRSIWLIGAMTLLTQNLFPWYMLWVLPLAAIFLQPGRLGLRADAWTGWWLFCGLVGFSYSFFVAWRPVPWAIWLQYLPLYALLLVDALRRLQARRWLRRRWPLQAPAGSGLDS